MIVTVPLFSFGDISFPSTDVSATLESSPYEPLRCYTKEIALITSTMAKTKSLSNITVAECRNYARNNNFDYFLAGASFCRYILI